MKALDRWWFAWGSGTTLGLLRILFGGLALANQLMVGMDWDAWFSPRGYTPAWMGRIWIGAGPQVAGVTLPRLNLLAGIENPAVNFAFYWLVTLAALLTMLGLWPKVSTIVLAVGVVTLQHKNPLILHGGDTVLRLMVMYLALAPAGATCSLDRLLRLARGRAPLTPPDVPLWTQRVIVYNVALLYFTTTWIKYFGGMWRDGTASWYPSRLNEFSRFPVPDFLIQMPMVKLTTWGTLLTEFSMGTLVFFRPLRKWILLAAAGMHLFIEWSMNVPLFSFLMISSYLAFYEGDEVQGWARRVGERLARFRTRVSLPGHPTPEGLAALRAMDPFGLVEYVPGGAGLSARELRAAALRSPGSWAFAWIPGVWRGWVSRALAPEASA